MRLAGLGCSQEASLEGVHAYPGDGAITWMEPVSYTHLRAHETVLDLVCRLLLEKKKMHTQEYLHTCVQIIHIQTQRLRD